MKNTQKHTQGPWGRNIAPAWKYPIIFAGRNTHVAKLITDELPESEQEANACLIAAAPDLLAALAEMLSMFGDHEQYDDESAHVVTQARAALAKAEGVK